MSSQQIAVIGAGNMGHGFAVHFAQHGYDVTLIDHRDSNLEWARDQIRDTVTTLNDLGIAPVSPSDTLDRVRFTLDEVAGVADAGVVLETVTEDLGVKRDVFGAVGPAAPSECVLASNTSGIPITDIQDGFAFADRVVGCHWWFPPYLLPPVEVVRGGATSQATIDRLVEFVESVDRDPIMVERDIPGFVWNRVQSAVFRECLHLAERGIASVDDINRAIRDGYATRTAAIGPFETMDIAGLELIETVAEEIQPHLCNDTEPSPVLADRLASGRGGIEDGAGFFEYDDLPEAVTRRRDQRVAAVRQALETLAER